MELKAIITYLKSLKFRIFLLIILFGIAPTFLLRAGILSAYEKRAVDTRTVDITSQAKLACHTDRSKQLSAGYFFQK